MSAPAITTRAWIDWSEWDADNGMQHCSCELEAAMQRVRPGRPSNHNTWTGCFTDRDQNYDTHEHGADRRTATLFPAEQYSYCRAVQVACPDLQPIMPLSYDCDRVEDQDRCPTPTGNTNQGIGMAWGWRR